MSKMQIWDSVFAYDQEKELELQTEEDEFLVKEYKRKKAAHIREIVETSLLTIPMYHLYVRCLMKLSHNLRPREYSAFFSIALKVSGGVYCGILIRFPPLSYSPLGHSFSRSIKSPSSKSLGSASSNGSVTGSCVGPGPPMGSAGSAPMARFEHGYLKNHMLFLRSKDTLDMLLLRLLLPVLS